MSDVLLFKAMLCALGTLAAVLGAMPLARRRAIKADFIDHPGGRKQHEKAVPPIGGLVVFPVFILATALGGLIAPQWMAFYAALGVLLATGALDDRYSVPPRIKFLAQFIAAFLIVVAGGARIYGLGNLFGFGDVWLGFMGIPFSLIATVLLINALNLMDGLDGLAGGTGFIALFWMMVASILAGQGAWALPLGVLMAALVGFLVYNMRNPWRRKAAVFMGDAGSLALGLSLAWFAMNLGHIDDGHAVHPISIAWILALPIMDTCAQFARRVSQGRHPFDADHHHFHHHFVNAGVPVARATALIVVLGFVLGGVGVVGSMLDVPDAVLSYAWIALLFAHIGVSLRPVRIRRVVSKLLRRNAETPPHTPA